MYLAKRLLAYGVGALLLSASFPMTVDAQDIQSSPYSRFGYGTMNDGAPVAYRGLGGVGIGVKDSRIINLNNPAGYAASDSLSFLMDIAVSVNRRFYQTGNVNQRTFLGGLDYLAVQFPIYHNRVVWAMGVKPLFNVGYRLSNNIPIKDDVQNNYITQDYEGNGSLQKGFMGLGVRAFSGLAFGFNINYLFGSESHVVSTNSTSPLIGNGYSSDRLSIHNWTIDFGVQYDYLFGKDHEVIVGATFSPSMTIRPERVYVENLNYGATSTNKVNRRKVDTETKTPMTLGFGLSYTHQQRLMIAGDVEFSKWKNIPNIFTNDGVQLNDNYKVALGAQYLPDIYSRSYGDRLIYRAGLNYRSSYMDIERLGQMNRLTAALGIGLPINVNDERTSYVNFSLEYTKGLPSSGSSLKEDMFRLSMSINFNETWFRKLKIY